ncbi:hypothetical protein [Clostridium beijerinckii]|nr:hypothetical protein [Clostridium beijerinckii]ABR33813.1 hypothetical protein Cbei_1639 [Clostridium beijerinckii NCIMB 8052]AIU04888.1 hypothetical protein Cbs_1639 [Clostridium beijerinckii ATCC 35702]MBF7812238.1 hypothetical protein [Clostridium beijerinckii]NRT24901.1 hypothetical protein [Clostridium beijerinckii]NRT67506.1 hypothetical protein [Clostridium beijerinckii]
MYINNAVGEMSETYGEMDSVNAVISQIKPGDIPLAQGVDLDSMKSMDSDPLEIVVEIPATKSKRGWNYTPKSLKDIVDYTNENTLNGFLGHQKAENISTEFVPPATHWIGAEMKDNKAYFRGLVDADATNLKRWIRTGRIKEVSIFGYPKLKKGAKGEMDVVGYNPLSIDWTPLHRPGMPTKIVSMEMSDVKDQIGGEQLDGTFEKLREDLMDAAKVYFNANNNGSYVWVRSIRYDDSTVIVEYEQQNLPSKLYSIPFTINNDQVVLGDKTEVSEKRIYEPVTTGEMSQGGSESMNFAEIMKNLKGLLQTGEVTYSQVLGEMGLTTDKIAGEMEDIKVAVEAQDTLNKVKEALNVSGEMDVVEFAKKAGEAIEHSKKDDLAKTIDEVINEKVVGEMAQGLVKKMLKVEEGATKEIIAGEIDSILADDFIKNLISSNHVDMPAGTATPSSGDKTTSTLKVKRASI